MLAAAAESQWLYSWLHADLLQRAAAAYAAVIIVLIGKMSRRAERRWAGAEAGQLDSVLSVCYYSGASEQNTGVLVRKCDGLSVSALEIAKIAKISRVKNAEMPGD